MGKGNFIDLDNSDKIQILVALSDQSNLDMIRQSMPADYHVVPFDVARAKNHIPDICIVDLKSWNDLDVLVENRHPKELLYRLLVVREDELNQLSTDIQDHVDDMIIAPLRTIELKIRLQSIVQTTKYARQVRWVYTRLSTTNRALESTSDAIVIADANSTIVYVNPAFEKIFGYDADTLNKQGIINTLFEEPALGRQIFRHIRQNSSWRGEVDLQKRDNTLIPFSFKIDHILDHHDEPIGFIMIFTDITLHKIVSDIQEEQRIQAEALLNTMRALSSTLDLDTVFDRMLDNINLVVSSDAANVIIIEGNHLRMVDRNDYEEHEMIKKMQNSEVHISEFDDLKQILQTNRPLIISDTEHYLEEHDDIQTHSPWLQSHLGIPIRLQDEIIGFINVDSTQPGLFQPIHVERLQIFAEQAAIAIHNARLHESAQKLAMFEERQRLSRNLHDAVSQILFSASMIAEALPNLWERDPEAVLPRLEQIQRLTRGALAEMRSMLLELNPDRFLETDISTLIEQLRDGVLGQAHIDVTLNMDEDLELRSPIKIALYYIVQEALNNIIKHAEANTASIQLTQQDELELIIHDDGQGFDTSMSFPTNFGIDNMRERAKMTDANLTIASTIGEGTTISVKWLVEKGNQ